MELVVIASARKHGIDDRDMLHAIRNAIRVHEFEGYRMYIGPGRSGQLLEIAISDRRQVFHAMRARPKYL